MRLVETMPGYITGKEEEFIEEQYGMFFFWNEISLC
jgi:hypothetical protein